MEQKTFIFSTVLILHMHICINKYMYAYMYICLYLYMLIFQYNEDNSYRKDFLIGELIHSNPDTAVQTFQLKISWTAGGFVHVFQTFITIQ